MGKRKQMTTTRRDAQRNRDTGSASQKQAQAAVYKHLNPAPVGFDGSKPVGRKPH